MCLGILQIMMALGPFSRWSVCACKPPRRRARGNRCPPPAFIIPLSTSPSGALDQDLGIATLKDSNESSLRVLSKISGAIYLRVPTLSNKCFFPNPSHYRHDSSTIKKDNHLVFGEMSRELFSSRYLTARPKSAITAVPSFLKYDENKNQLAQYSLSVLPDKDVPGLDVPMSDRRFAATSRDLCVQVAHPTSDRVSQPGWSDEDGEEEEEDGDMQ